jgi:dTDP-4-amino-4,6-dideoxygalactose transaminase
MAEFLKIKKEFGILLIEDCAQAHGAQFQGKRVGSFGDASTFSFYATKNMITGEGGMVLFSNRAASERARSIINHGRSGPYQHSTVGFNFRMTNIEAAIGRSQLAKLEVMNRKRREIAEMYRKAWTEVEWLQLPAEPPGYFHVYHQFTIRTRSRDGLKAHLESRGIASAVIYPTPNCLQPAYGGRYCSCGDCNCACNICLEVSKEVLSLPIFPALVEEEVRRITSEVLAFNPDHGGSR